MRALGYPVVFDATHSVQCRAARRQVVRAARVSFPTSRAGRGRRRAIFMEIREPDAAPSDGPNMIPLARLEGVLREVLAVREALAGTRDT